MAVKPKGTKGGRSMRRSGYKSMTPGKAAPVKRNNPFFGGVPGSPSTGQPKPKPKSDERKPKPK